MGSLAGAARLLNDTAGGLSGTQKEQKSFVEAKAKSSVDSDFNVNTNRESVAYRSSETEQVRAEVSEKLPQG